MRHRLSIVLLSLLLLPALAPRALAQARPRPAETDQYIKVEVRGIIKTGILAVGAETTGVTITARGVVWELDFGRNARLRALADQHNGKTVIVTGIYNAVPGTEIQERHIVTVTGLVPAR